MNLEEQDKRLKELQAKYPNAATDDFENYCMTWEFIQGDKGSWFVTCPDENVEEKLKSFQKLFDQETGLKGGVALQAFSNQPNASPTAFQVVCYEDAQDDIKAKLQQISIEDSQMEWTPEEVLRKQFEEWKSKQVPI